MAYTRAQLRTRLLRRLDAASSSRWDTTAGNTGEVDQVLSFVADREWRRILNANPFYRTAHLQPTTDSAGRIAISDLTSGSGDTIKRFYRVLAVLIDGVAYQEVDAKDFIHGSVHNFGDRTFFRNGDYVQLLPVRASTALSGADETIVVNHIPCSIQDLSADSVNVVFPDGYEEILVLEAAAFLFAKGGTELDSTGPFRALAESLRQEMLADIQRFTINPMRMKYSDNSSDWAG